MNKLTGLIAAPFTPMNDAGDLNLSQVKTLVELYNKNGVGGAFICGTTGEGASLTHDEKKQVFTIWGQKKEEQLKVIGMLGGTCLKEMQELAQVASKCKLDGIAILCPYYFRPGSVKELVTFCQEVASAAPDLPFYYYHIPAFTGGNFSMLEFLKQGEAAIPSLAGIKFTAPDLFDFQACTAYKNGKYNLLWGIDEALLSGLAAGADGAVGSTYNYVSPLYNRIITAFENKDLERARELQLKAVRIVQVLVKFGGIPAGKAFMKAIGVDCGWFRLPVRALSDQEIIDFNAELKEIGFFEDCSKL